LGFYGVTAIVAGMRDEIFDFRFGILGAAIVAGTKNPKSKIQNPK
jgi:hypothetical protein